jgi:site-specific recombinase XerD
MLRTDVLPRFGNQHLDKITTQAISDFHHGLVSKGLAKGTANRGLVLLKYMFNVALKWNTPGVTENPAKGIKLFNPNNARERYLTAEETQRLLAAVEKSKNTQLKYIVPLLLLLGCRKRETPRCQMGGIRSGPSGLAYSHEQVRKKSSRSTQQSRSGYHPETAHI